jgi:hypothetical protein
MIRNQMAFGLGIAILAGVGDLTAQEPQLTFGGQIRPRMESRGGGGISRETFTSMRVRAQLQARLGEDARVFIQLQDVRYFGEETNTLSDYQADALDLHQGYLELGLGSEPSGALRVGRQALALGEQRLVGAVEWTQQGRAFDGARYTASALGPIKLDIFAMKLQEESAATHDFDGEFFGAYSTLDLQEAGFLDLYALLTTDSREGGSDEHTLGGSWKGTAGPMALRVEGTLQSGHRDGVDVSAYMVGARAGIAVHDDATLTLWYDYLSGDPDPDDGQVEVFNTLFATNHAFYGSADLFLNIPNHTGGLGLRDAALKLALNPSDRTVLGLDLHAFSTAEVGDLTTRSLARELDIILTHRMPTGITVACGFSYVRAQDGIQELGRLEEDATWTFLMLNAVF